jgi:hypothetical protein
MFEKSDPYAARVVTAAAVVLLLCIAPAYANGKVNMPAEPMIQVWEHSAKVDIGPIVKQVGFNTVWTHDRAYDGYSLEDTLMYRHLNTPGVKYVIAKIERSVWGWNHEQSLKHADWIAKASRDDKRIIGVYLNDFYGEIDAARRPPAKPDPRSQGGRTEEQWREIIARLRAGNPELAIWVPCYPRNELGRPFDFDIDAVIFNFYAQGLIPYAEELLSIAQKKFKGKTVIAGLYLNSGTERRWLTEEEFKGLMSLFVRLINERKIHGLRIFRSEDMIKRPEFATWAAEATAKIKRRR